MSSSGFRVGAHIGSGGFGRVDEAVRINAAGEVVETRLARKQLLPMYAKDAEALARFRREVRLLDEMDHPNVLPVVGRNLSDDPPWFVMPQADQNLGRWLAVGNVGDRERVVTMFSGVLNGMAYAHSQRRILHRDLKPENVLIVGGTPMVGDFGLGKRLDLNTVDLTSTNIGMGTVAYMAPEQFTDAAHVGPPADVYALGKMLGELLTGARPVVGRPRLEHVPEEFRSFIDRCTQDDPADRYANASDAVAAFQLLVSGGGATGEVSGGSLEDRLKLWEATPDGADCEIVEAIAYELLHRRSDEELYFRALPRLPPLLITQLIKQRPGDFDLILRSYNEHIQGSLPFEYCDVVANLYRLIFRESSDLAHRRLVLVRLISLGPRHNRWHVGEVVASLLEGIEDPRVAQMAASAIREEAYDARWFKPYVANRRLPSPVIAAFNSLDPEADARAF